MEYFWWFLGYEEEEYKPSEESIRKRHEMLKQVKLSKIKLKNSKINDKTKTLLNDKDCVALLHEKEDTGDEGDTENEELPEPLELKRENTIDIDPSNYYIGCKDLKELPKGEGDPVCHCECETCNCVCDFNCDNETCPCCNDEKQQEKKLEKQKKKDEREKRRLERLKKQRPPTPILTHY